MQNNVGQHFPKCTAENSSFCRILINFTWKNILMSNIFWKFWVVYKVREYIYRPWFCCAKKKRYLVPITELFCLWASTSTNREKLTCQLKSLSLINCKKSPLGKYLVNSKLKLPIRESLLLKSLTISHIPNGLWAHGSALILTTEEGQGGHAALCWPLGSSLAFAEMDPAVHQNQLERLLEMHIARSFLWKFWFTETGVKLRTHILNKSPRGFWCFLTLG